jgi:hypothetical protein
MNNRLAPVTVCACVAARCRLFQNTNKLLGVMQINGANSPPAFIAGNVHPSTSARRSNADPQAAQSSWVIPSHCGAPSLALKQMAQYTAYILLTASSQPQSGQAFLIFEI